MFDADHDRIHVTSTSVVYPTGNGGSDAALANSLFKTSACGTAVIAGVVVTSNSAGLTLTIYGIDGTTVLQTLVLAANVLGSFSLFDMRCPKMTSGAVTNGGFGVKVSAGAATVFFRQNQG